ncbi:hypothetical protein PG994_001225 [Apiospora phragmitis]|uniref:Uncharacterized protein n=1 Tax=Apiospora phragmitis TaxID=2905665 RepID=A0ABR1WSX1_9PEZI
MKAMTLRNFVRLLLPNCWYLCVEERQPFRGSNSVMESIVDEVGSLTSMPEPPPYEVVDGGCNGQNE